MTKTSTAPRAGRASALLIAATLSLLVGMSGAGVAQANPLGGDPEHPIVEECPSAFCPGTNFVQVGNGSPGTTVGPWTVESGIGTRAGTGVVAFGPRPQGPATIFTESNALSRPVNLIPGRTYQFTFEPEAQRTSPQAEMRIRFDVYIDGVLVGSEETDRPVGETDRRQIEFIATAEESTLLLVQSTVMPPSPTFRNAYLTYVDLVVTDLPEPLPVSILGDPRSAGIGGAGVLLASLVALGVTATVRRRRRQLGTAA